MQQKKKGQQRKVTRQGGRELKLRTNLLRHQTLPELSGYYCNDCNRMCDVMHARHVLMYRTKSGKQINQNKKEEGVG